MDHGKHIDRLLAPSLRKILTHASESWEAVGDPCASDVLDQPENVLSLSYHEQEHRDKPKVCRILAGSKQMALDSG